MLVKVTNGTVTQYPYTTDDLRRDNPNVGFPAVVSEAIMAGYGVTPVIHETTPSHDPMTHFVQVGELPVLKDGKWVLTKTVVAMTQEQIAARMASWGAEVRQLRNRLLGQTDWMALSDNTMPPEWVTYRQNLRNVPQQDGFPFEVIWPDKPL